MSTIKLIYNPASGRMQQEKTIDSLFALLRKKGHQVHKYPTTEQERADAQVSKFADDYDLVIGCGGDGTANELVNGLMKLDQPVPFALLPLGTVNDFATHMGLPKNLEQFSQMITEKRVRSIDLGRAGDKYFLNVAAAGSLTEIAYDVPQKQKATLGRLAYYLKGVGEIPKQWNKTKQLRVTIGQETHRYDCLLFLLTNSPKVGGFRVIKEGADVDDGYLHLLVMEEVKPHETLELIGDLLSGALDRHTKIHYHKTKALTIESSAPLVVDLDGEKDGSLPMTFTIVEKALELIVP